MTYMEVMKVHKLHISIWNNACKAGIVTCDSKWNSAVNQNCIDF